MNDCDARCGFTLGIYLQSSNRSQLLIDRPEWTGRCLLFCSVPSGLAGWSVGDGEVVHTKKRFLARRVRARVFRKISK